MNLYEITSGMAAVEAKFEREEIDEQTHDDTLELLKYELEHKGDNIVKLLSNLRGRAEAVKAEKKRLDELEKKILNRAEAIELMVKRCMEYNGMTKIESTLATFSFRKSETTEIDNEAEIPAKYKTIIPETYKVDKVAIKAAIKAGEIVPGAHVATHQNLQIK